MSFLTNTVGNLSQAAKNVVVSQSVDRGQAPQQTNDQTTNESSNQDHKPSSDQPPSSSVDFSPGPQDEPKSSSGFISGIGKASSTITSTTTSGLTSGINFTSDLAKNGAQLASDTANAGVSISRTVARSGLDMSIGVVGGTADLAGTAIGGIVNTAAETSGKVFEPVASGLKAVEGFDKLGDGLMAINGLPVGAVQTVGRWTMTALNMSGKTPTFFDPDGDGTVTVSDTIKGLIVLGLDEKNSKYAAYVLHGIFSFPTGTSWVPTDTNLPITVSNMSRTRWGKNWGQYDRMEWVQDVDINQFFAESSEDVTWQEKFKKGRQYFGILLLIFEWGTTWPFLMPDLPVEQIPFKDDIGKVVRTLILPTIFSNFQRARAGKVDAGNQPPAKEAPSGPDDA
ncbi:uncharacterized protein C8R40DRAFT_1176669 [Lentinula edodes]|uniref:uncharacterized protein n=1 Tax=Lentinula edodes TaxID=5353 RepID=UPI001E8CE9C9|nr:uncharacterized protein C8R40DRAFT_1176669 [Lentinula edodes]KAH7869525.1 hypothetical protein C8R40DRAFT_1176669 [Lentinula edodes]